MTFKMKGLLRPKPPRSLHRHRKGWLWPDEGACAGRRLELLAGLRARLRRALRAGRIAPGEACRTDKFCRRIANSYAQRKCQTRPHYRL